MDKQSKLPIVIIGAGLSGLLIAYRLKKAGLAIKILEARDRAGGRINTVTGVDGTLLEMGATWFGNQHQHLRRLLEELKISAFKQYTTRSVVFEASPLSASQRIQVPPQEPSYRIVGGTGQIIQTLLNFFTAEEILFNQQVKQISVGEDQVHIKTNNSIFSAKKTVCCVPPALLVGSIDFEPALPEAIYKEAESTHTWMQESVKAGVTYRKAFWRDIDVSVIVSNEGPVIEYYDHSDADNNKFGLCGFLHPDYGVLDREERERQVIDQLKRLLGKEAGEYTDYEEVIWGKEKFTNANTGATFLPHQNNGNNIFQEPLYGGKVRISSSETSAVYGGYMEGAVYIANETATRLLQEES